MSSPRCPECRVIDGHMRDCSLAGKPDGLPASNQAPLLDVRPAVARQRSRPTSPDDYKKADRAAGRRNMMIGGLWLAGGALVSGITFAMASSSPNGGHYYLTFGALIFGAAQFFKGLAQTLR